jgi:hypothetical protein
LHPADSTPFFFRFVGFCGSTLLLLLICKQQN